MLIGLVVLFGAGAAVDVCGCYNIGLIDGYGNEWSKPLSSPVGGIIGYLSDNSTWLGLDDKQITTKYLQFTFEIKTLGLHNFTNKLSYCYNSGTLNGDYSIAVDTTHYNGGIVGFIGWGFGAYTSVVKWMAAIITGDTAEHHTQVIDCYYCITGKTSTGTNNLLGNDKATGKTADELKQILYNWASKPSGSGGLILPGTTDTYIYNTTAPVETSLGFEGYGILWWQLKDYNNVEFYIGSYYTIGGKESFKEIENEHSTTLKIAGKSVTIDDNNKKTFNEEGINCNFHNWKMMIKSGKYNLEVSATDYGKATKNEYEINDTSKNKILGLLQTGAETTQLEKSGNTKYNWNHDFTVSVPHTYTFISNTPYADNTFMEANGVWEKSDYWDETYTVSTKFKDSKEENSTYLAQVYLDGLDGFLNPRTGKTNYKWNYNRIGYLRPGDILTWGISYWNKGSNVYSYEHEGSIELDSKCTISIPMESLIDATSDKDLKYDPETCKVAKADLTIKFSYWINENIISKLDFTGTAAELTEKLRNFSSG